MEDNKQLAQRIDGAIQSASQEVTNLRSELSATSRRLAELGASSPPALENHLQHNHHDDGLHYRGECHTTDMNVKMCRAVVDTQSPASMWEKSEHEHV